MATAIQYESQLPALISTLMGEKQTTGSSSTTKGNTDALQQVFQRAMTQSGAGVPEMQQLILSIFQEGAAKVPELAQAYASSVGARTSNNSGLMLALQDLNRKMSTDAAMAITNNQQKNLAIANDSAAQIANADKTVTNNQSTAKGAKTNPLIPILAGWGLNKAGAKGGILDKLFKSDKDATNVTDVTSTPISSPITSNNVDMDSAANFNNSATIAPIVDGGTDFNIADFGPDPMSVDFGPEANADFGIGDFDPLAAVDATDFDFDFSGFEEAFGDFDLGFANGGVVGAIGKVNKQPKGYANGGIVRNKTYMGDTAQRPQPASMAENVAAQVAPPKATNSTTTKVRPRRPDPETPDNVGGIGITNADNTGGVVGTPAQNNAIALGLVSTMASLATGIPVAVINAAIGGKSLTSAAIGNLSSIGTGTTSGTTAPDGRGVVSVSDISAITQDDAPPVDASVDSVDGGVSGGGIGGVGGGTGPASSGVGDAVGPSYANGGHVKGPGTGTSDSIDAKLSDGEYVIPADVVRFLGTKHLDRLIASAHKPVAASR